MTIDHAIELLQNARARYGGDRDMIITDELLSDLLRALDLAHRDLWMEPRIRRVTPEAMVELERIHASRVLIFTKHFDYCCSFTDRGWVRHDAHSNTPIPRPSCGWFLVRSEIPEAT